MPSHSKKAPDNLASSDDDEIIPKAVEYKSMKTQRRLERRFASKYKKSTRHRESLIRTLHSSVIKMNTHVGQIEREMKILQNRLVASKAARRQLVTFCKQTLKSQQFDLMNAIASSLLEANKSPPAWSSMIVLCDPTNFDNANELNKVRVESVDFELYDIVFDKDQPALQETWDQVKHLFAVEPFSTTYELRKNVLDDGTDTCHWAIKQCIQNNIGFFSRRDASDDESELNHDGFTSLCETRIPLNGSIFDPANVQYDAAKGVQTATLKLIVINPIAGAESAMTPKLWRVLNDTFIRSIVESIDD